VSVLVVGLSHKSAPVSVLERAALSGDTLAKLLRDVARADSVAEAFVVSTCNRVEVYADVDRFHPGVTAICELLSRHSGLDDRDLTPHLYLHYEDRAAAHLLAVACGLDSVVVGEGQILGQVRSALKLAEEYGTVGRVLGELGRLALRAGKRARAETGIARAGQSLATVAVEQAAARLGGLVGRDVLVVGAGSMSALVAAAARQNGAASIAIANRSHRHAERLAGNVCGHAVAPADLSSALAAADLVISCTGAPSYVIDRNLVAAALASRKRQNRRGPLLILDLALPRDVAPAVADLPGTVVIGMDELSQHPAAAGTEDISEVRAICSAELAAYQSAADAARVAPTVVALRAKAATVVDAELARLAGRLSAGMLCADGLSAGALEEITHTVHRVVDKLLHAPTVRVKELASSPGGEDYAAALRVLFDLDPRTVEAITRTATQQEDTW
jgi:glutamyl-tRNA reductase